MRYGTFVLLFYVQSSTIVNVKSFLLMLNWIIKGQQQTHWIIKWDSIHLCCLTYLIIAACVIF